MFPAGVLNVTVTWVASLFGGVNDEVVFTGPVSVSGTVGPFCPDTAAAPVTWPLIVSVPLVVLGVAAGGVVVMVACVVAVEEHPATANAASMAAGRILDNGNPLKVR
jgi:hypothetical protein